METKTIIYLVVATLILCIIIKVAAHYFKDQKNSCDVYYA